MRMPTSHQVRKQFVKEALKEKAPRTYRELERSGELEQFLNDRADEMWEAYGQDESEIMFKALKEDQEDYLEFMRNLNAALSRLTEQVLATWLEFSDPPITASQRES